MRGISMNGIVTDTSHKRMDGWMIGSVRSYLSVFIILLVVEVSFESQFGSTDHALETSSVEKGEVFERAHFVHLIHCLATSQTQILVRRGVESLGDRHVFSGWRRHPCGFPRATGDLNPLDSIELVDQCLMQMSEDLRNAIFNSRRMHQQV